MLIRRFLAASLFLLALPLFFTLTPLSATGAESTDQGFPSRVSQGRAFVVRWLKKDLSVTDDKIIWREKEIPLQARTSPNGGEVTVEALLAMPQDAEGTLPLVLHLDGQRYALEIEAAPVPWATQVLSVEPKYVEPPEEVRAKIAEEAETNRALQAAMRPEAEWSLPFQRPVRGGVSSAFGGRRVFNGQLRSAHRGTDMRAPMGTPARALAAGTVVLAASQYYSGNVVFVDHGQGVVSMYAHLSAFDVRVGDRVEKGQQIGKTGATGRVTGPHLHLGLMIQGVAVDAVPLFAPALEPVGGPTREDPVVK